METAITVLFVLIGLAGVGSIIGFILLLTVFNPFRSGH